MAGGVRSGAKVGILSGKKPGKTTQKVQKLESHMERCAKEVFFARSGFDWTENELRQACSIIRDRLGSLGNVANPDFKRCTCFSIVFGD